MPTFTDLQAAGDEMIRLTAELEAAQAKVKLLEALLERWHNWAFAGTTQVGQLKKATAEALGLPLKETAKPAV